MMKNKTVFVCQNCGYQSVKWLGRCPDCNSWNSLVEESTETFDSGTRPALNSSPRLLKEVQMTEEARIKTGSTELDGILGGGIVPGSSILIGGAPGIGKSTLTLQASNQLAMQGRPVLYVSAEESMKQTRLRANRLGEVSDKLFIFNQTNLESVIEYIRQLSPEIVIIDSIQVVYTSRLTSGAGSVSQVRECAAMLILLAKSLGFSLFLIGHVTKEGQLAGPRILEHMVDCVLYFEGERHTIYRILRAVKNRFGTTRQIGVFEMTSKGLIEISNPSQLFLSERPTGASGSMVVPLMEGRRPLLVEIQALVTPAYVGGPLLPRRRAIGVDYNRMCLLVAVLEKRANLKLKDKDVFVNVAGGIRVAEPASDLAMVIAIASSLKDVATPEGDLALGEVGLVGEVRSVTEPRLRLKEAERLGFKRCILSEGNLKGLEFKGSLELVGIKTIKEALRAALE